MPSSVMTTTEVATCNMSSALRQSQLRRTMHSQQSLRKTTCKQEECLLIHEAGGFLKLNTTAVGDGWLGRTLFSNVGSEEEMRTTTLPPYLRSRADQTASEQPWGRRSESCCREKTRPTACLPVARLIGRNCGANQLKAAIVAALLC